MPHRIALFTLIIILAAAPLAAQDTELPVRRVVLYKHGVGFFERSAEVASGSAIRLQFKAEEMDDVLKSLTIDSRAGAVAGVRYDSNEPLEKKLENFPFRLGEAQPLTRILDQFKGSRVRLRLTADQVEGTIISARTIPATAEQPESHVLLLLSDDGEMRTIDPASALGLSFADPRIQQQFRDYLMLLAGARNRDKRNVTIETAENRGGLVRARYVVPTPIWKSSYRLILDAEDRPLLEGWAIVDNTTGEDWENISLSLVSGRPVSFISRLYEPRYVDRPVFELAQDRAQQPIVHGAGIETERAEQGQRDMVQAKALGNLRAGRVAAAPAPAREMAAGGFAGGVMTDEARNASSTVAQTASAGELGDLFEYRIDRPITVGQGESAMLPFLQQRVAGRKLLIYNEAHGSQHPLNAVEITNDSGKTLDGGAVTVLDAGAYAGEALFETIKDDDKRLISYAVDLGMRITTAYDSSSKLLSDFTLRRGVMSLRYARKDVRTFTIRNVDQKPKTVVIEMPVRAGFKPIGKEPTEKTADAYRYEVAVPEGETVQFPVTEENEYVQSLSITNQTYDQLITYVQNKELNAAGRAKLEQIADVKRRLADTNREIEMLELQIKEVFEDQNRLRQNISSLRSVSGQEAQVQKYALTLAEQEVDLTSKRDQQAQLRRQGSGLQTELNTLIETLVI
ncbi:MAG TPA: hypothetical protein VML01_07255 [Bryobacterales bacterium]|nr:hypothetical protein [Bryobacterales bacterium]